MFEQNFKNPLFSALFGKFFENSTIDPIGNTVADYKNVCRQVCSACSYLPELQYFLRQV
jgi:hypothetical protein